MDIGIRDNAPMQKDLLRQILAANIERAMEGAGFSTQPQLAKKARIGQSSVSRILRGESSATTDMIAALAEALKCQPWELLTDNETTRKAALERMILGPQATEHLAPAARRKPKRKKGRDGNDRA